MFLGLFEAVKLKNYLGEEDVYVDGGLLCNYPIHAFDGGFDIYFSMYALNHT